MDLCSLLHEEQLHVSAPLIGHLQVQKWKKHSKQLYLTSVGCIQWGGQGCIQPTQVECSCLRMFLIYQPEIDQWKEPKHVVVLYVINYTYLYHHIVVLDRYTHCNLVYYKHNGDDEPYDQGTCWITGCLAPQSVWTLRRKEKYPAVAESQNTIPLISSL